MDALVLKAENIKKSFFVGDLVTEVLKGVNMEIRAGEFVAIVGESGSGKSTMLYILAGIDKPTEGTVTLLGRDLNRVPDGELAAMRRRDFSFVYQFDNLVPNMTAYENIALPLVLDKKKESEYKNKISETAKYLGIDERLKNYPREMSGGEQQRVAIARALVTDPKIIFLDEPTGSLDKERGRQVMELLADINKNMGVALAMVTHSPAHAAYASRIVEMEDGVIKAAAAEGGEDCRNEKTRVEDNPDLENVSEKCSEDAAGKNVSAARVNNVSGKSKNKRADFRERL